MKKVLKTLIYKILIHTFATDRIKEKIVTFLLWQRKGNIQVTIARFVVTVKQMKSLLEKVMPGISVKNANLFRMKSRLTWFAAMM